MDITVYNQNGEEKSVAALPKVFDVPVNRDLLTQVVNAEIANARPVVAATKGRGDVRGGGKKPWRQKGTGRARHGSIRSPIWKGGGVTHGPTAERNFKKKINRKMASLAIAMAVSGKAKDGELVIFDELVTNGKTKAAAGILKEAAKRSVAALAQKSAVLVLPEKTDSSFRAFRNIRGMEVAPVSAVTASTIVKGAILVMTEPALSALGERIQASLKKKR